MNIFEQATRQGLRFTMGGTVSVEELWGFSLTTLKKYVNHLNKEVKASQEEDLFAEKTQADADTKLRFDIVMSIISTLTDEAEQATKALSVKEERQRLLAIKHRKQEAVDENLSDEELDKKLAELG